MLLILLRLMTVKRVISAAETVNEFPQRIVMEGCVPTALVVYPSTKT